MKCFKDIFYFTRTGLTREPRGLPHLIKMADSLPDVQDLDIGAFKTKNKRTGKNKKIKSNFLNLILSVKNIIKVFIFSSLFFRTSSGWSSLHRDSFVSWRCCLQILQLLLQCIRVLQSGCKNQRSCSQAFFYMYFLALVVL